jgi:hypothetical protein
MVLEKANTCFSGLSISSGGFNVPLMIGRCKIFDSLIRSEPKIIHGCP